MRPERLVIEGLRSYRDTADIDFTDLGLTALIGDTGAGKSSVIEALTAALYNRPTWTGRGVQALRSDNAPAMRIVLTFSVGTRDATQRWTVTRIHRAGPSAAVHKLECLDTGEKVDGERAINARIEALIGLSPEQFTKAVAIPQGQFARLLEATEGERTKILKSIFRLDHLTSIKEHADALHRRYADLVAQRRGRRQALPSDPANALAASQAAMSEATADLERLTATATDAERHAANAEATAKDAEDITGAVGEVTLRLDRDDHTALEKAARVDAEVRTAIADADSERRTAESAMTDALERAAGALYPFPTRDAAVTARSTITTATGQAVAVSRKTRDLETRRAELDEPELASARVAATEKARAARAEAEAKAQAATAAEPAVGQAQRRADLARTNLRAVQSAVVTCEQVLDTARAALDAAIEANALAAVAGDCRPGDDCPVCARPLPEGFASPTDANIDAARATVAYAVDALDQARSVIDDAGAEVEDADASLEAARAERDAANAAATAADQEANAAETAAARLVEAHRAEREALDRDQATLEDERRRCQQPLDELPDAYSFTFGDAASAKARLERLDEALDGAQQAEATAEEARTRVQAAAEAARAAGERRDVEVRQPTARVRERATALADRLTQLAALVPDATVTPDDPGGDASTDMLAEWVRDLHIAADAATAGAIAAADEANGRAVDERTAVDTICHAARVEDIASLHQAVADAQGRAAVAAHDAVAARDAVATASLLDEFLAVGEPFIANLDTLRQTLTDSQFIRALVAEREHELLVEASRKLRDLTGDNFGYGATFKIVDRRTGQQRPPETLSGGEQFLASLALALALVEIATRGGGQLDAMFLDEGFGSLDSASLDQALNTLGTLAVGGKLVMLVSHLRRVAEHVDEVLLVERDDVLGSHVRRLDPDERDTLLAEDARSGLTR